MPKIIGLEKEKKILETAIEKDQSVLLIGETGVGKTSLIRELAFKEKKVFRRLNLNGNTGVEEFVGKMVLEATGKGTRTKWIDGILIDAMRQGHWLLVDEINAALPEILFILQSLLDDDKFIVLADNDGEVVRPHKDFRLFAAMNPPADYAGTKKLNRSLMSRFQVVVKMPSPDADAMKSIVHEHVGKKNVDPVMLNNVIGLAQHINNSNKDGSLDFYCSVRDVISLANLMQYGNDVETAFRLAILNKADEQDTKAILALASLYLPITTEDGKRMLTPEEKEKHLIEAIKEELQEKVYEIDRENFEGVIKATVVKMWETLKAKDKIDENALREGLRSIKVSEFLNSLISEEDSRAVTARALTEVYASVKKEQPVTA